MFLIIHLRLSLPLFIAFDAQVIKATAYTAERLVQLFTCGSDLCVYVRAAVWVHALAATMSIESSPFRNLCSISEVISGGEDVARAILNLVESLKDAPPVQFKHLANNIGQTATLLACTVHLVRNHHSHPPLLFKPELANLVSDVNGHFGIIQETVRRWIKNPRGRWRRLKWLYWSGRVTNFIRRLQTLMACLEVIVMVAAVAANQSSGSAAWQLVLYRSQALRAIEEGRFQTAHLQRSHVEKEPVLEVPRPYRNLSTLSESALHVAEWMSTILSAHSIPLKGAAGAPPPPGVVKYERSKYAFAPTIRPSLEIDAEGSRLLFAYESIHLPALVRMGIQYTIEDSEGANFLERKVVAQVDKGMRNFEIDLIISTSEVMKAIPSKEWKPSTSPWMQLSPDEVLGRLLKAWTVLDDGAIEAILEAPTPPLQSAIKQNGDLHTGFKFQPEPEGEEFNREEFERSESLRDWNLHMPTQQESHLIANMVWDSRSRLSDSNFAGQHGYMGLNGPQTKIPPVLLPAVHESPSVAQRVSYPAGMDPAWIQDFQERIDLREKVQGLEQKFQIIMDHARVERMERDNELESLKGKELQMAAKLAQEHEIQLKYEQELKKASMQNAHIESNQKQTKEKMDEIKTDIIGFKEELTQLKGKMYVQETASKQIERKELDSYNEDLERWKLKMMEHHTNLQQQIRQDLETEISAIERKIETVMIEINDFKQSERAKDHSETVKTRTAFELKLHNLQKENNEYASKIRIIKESADKNQFSHEEETKTLTNKIRRLKKQKLKLELELGWIKESLLERIKTEREAARCAALLECREGISRCEQSLTRNTDDEIGRLSNIGDRIEVVAEAEDSKSPVQVFPRPPESTQIDVMDFAVTTGGIRTEWSADGLHCNTDGLKVNGIVSHEHEDPNKVPSATDELEDRDEEEHLPRVEDFLIPGTEDDPGFKSHMITFSRLWKGIGGIEAPILEGISPVYVRGNGLGETLYSGPSPVHVRELSEDYNPNLTQEYLTVNKVYLETQVLDQFGIEYVDLGDGQLSLNPSTTIVWPFSSYLFYPM